MRKHLFLILFSMAASLSAQESIIKDFAESRRDLKFCLYPSTLRMININKDPAYNELVSDVEKLLIYKLDSATIASNEYLGWTQKYTENGFEEYIYMRGKINLTLLGKDEEFIGVSGANDNVVAFYLRGNIALQKIPELVQTFEKGDILSMLTDRFND